jgi:hypothetical protein
MKMARFCLVAKILEGKVLSVNRLIQKRFKVRAEGNISNWIFITVWEFYRHLCGILIQQWVFYVRGHRKNCVDKLTYD